ncbi:2-keto-4-pentenoate hydratase [Chelatococcus reniformis]|uniref:Fumarylacetoacetate (FAA) hydrolase n=1 Tax=Chelatococcus reniformis TaxID=1494448 RepID=A0A916XEZ5_9HYPH|nr:fumarylacetoacetate hydrolase family protein [Chelatococcus reniformis]GGC65681.1 fumarylacetoacetate (FAA) hydrolase [Chelatococcus reniformis]
MTALVSDLLRARETRAAIADAIELPASLAAAYAVQDEHIGELLARIGGTRIGYKIGATTQAALDALGLARPFHGPILSAAAHASPAHLSRSSFFVAIAETEIGFRFGRDLPPRAAPYDLETVAAAVAEIVPIIEVADSRMRDWQKADARLIVADLGYAGAVVTGAPVRDWRAVDLPSLAVTLEADGREIAKGAGAAVLGNPLACLTGLVNDLSAAGQPVRAGELVSSGTCTPPHPSAMGGHFVARFGPLGTVELTLD